MARRVTPDPVAVPLRRLSMTIDSPGFRVDCVVTDGRDTDEVIDAIAFAAKLRSGGARAATPGHDQEDHDQQRAALRQLFGNLCDHLLDDAGKLLADERARRESLS